MGVKLLCGGRQNRFIDLMIAQNGKDHGSHFPRHMTDDRHVFEPFCGFLLVIRAEHGIALYGDLRRHPDASAQIRRAPFGHMRVRSLELAAQIYKQKVNVTRSEFLPSVALIGNYMATNPSVFNSFENKFKGMWNVGVMVSIPVWHWGEGIYKVKAAKSEARISRYQLDDAKEKIELQVSQSVFKVNEAAKKLIMAEKNLEKADENLRYATLGFEEGVIPASNVLEAHTAWLSAQSEKIDAQIDVKLTEIYLKKATGSLNIEN